MTATSQMTSVPAAPVLGDLQLRRLRALLHADHDEQRREIDDLEALVDELTDAADDDKAGLDREFARASLERAVAALEETSDAIARLALGTYGLCESCGRAIPFERLEAIPHARRCVACPLRHGVGAASRRVR